VEGVAEKDDNASSRMYSFWLPDIFIKKSLNIPEPYIEGHNTMNKKKTETQKWSAKY
jgi:hypothetical protein